MSLPPPQKNFARNKMDQPYFPLLSPFGRPVLNVIERLKTGPALRERGQKGTEEGQLPNQLG